MSLEEELAKNTAALNALTQAILANAVSAPVHIESNPAQETQIAQAETGAATPETPAAGKRGRPPKAKTEAVEVELVVTRDQVYALLEKVAEKSRDLARDTLLANKCPVNEQGVPKAGLINDEDLPRFFAALGRALVDSEQEPEVKEQSFV